MNIVPSSPKSGKAYNTKRITDIFKSDFYEKAIICIVQVKALYAKCKVRRGDQ